MGDQSPAPPVSRGSRPSSPAVCLAKTEGQCSSQAVRASVLSPVECSCAGGRAGPQEMCRKCLKKLQNAKQTGDWREASPTLLLAVLGGPPENRWQVWPQVGKDAAGPPRPPPGCHAHRPTRHAHRPARHAHRRGCGSGRKHRNQSSQRAGARGCPADWGRFNRTLKNKKSKTANCCQLLPLQ